MVPPNLIYVIISIDKNHVCVEDVSSFKILNSLICKKFQMWDPYIYIKLFCSWIICSSDLSWWCLFCRCFCLSCAPTWCTVPRQNCNGRQMSWKTHWIFQPSVAFKGKSLHMCATPMASWEITVGLNNGFFFSKSLSLPVCVWIKYILHLLPMSGVSLMMSKTLETMHFPYLWRAEKCIKSSPFNKEILTFKIMLNDNRMRWNLMLHILYLKR